MRKTPLVSGRNPSETQCHLVANPLGDANDIGKSINPSNSVHTGHMDNTRQVALLRRHVAPTYFVKQEAPRRPFGTKSSSVPVSARDQEIDRANRASP